MKRKTNIRLAFLMLCLVLFFARCTSDNGEKSASDTLLFPKGELVFSCIHQRT